MAKKDELNFENENKIAPSEKLKALQAAMDKIEKSFGKGSIMKMGDESVEQVEVIPTGSIGLNVALGVGGYPRGRIIEIYGPESSGKTTLAICHCQLIVLLFSCQLPEDDSLEVKGVLYDACGGDPDPQDVLQGGEV